MMYAVIVIMEMKNMHLWGAAEKNGQQAVSN